MKESELTKLRMLGNRFTIVMQLRDTFVSGAEEFGRGLTYVLKGSFLILSSVLFLLPAFIYELLKPVSDQNP